LGVTGSGKTFTVANVIQHHNVPTLVMAITKPWRLSSATSCGNFSQTTLSSILSVITIITAPKPISPRATPLSKRRLPSTKKLTACATPPPALLDRRDVIIVASVSCIYGLGTPQEYLNAAIQLKTGQMIDFKKLLYALTEVQYQRNDYELSRGMFRVRGEMLEIGLPL
jgi:excinuclease ABC subunit B